MRALFETAAEAGDARGIYQYGMMLMWSQRDPDAAEAMLVRAGEMGQSQAWATLAEGAMYGYLGNGRTSRAKFPTYATRARDAGNQQIDVLDATRHMWGITVRASGPETIEMLETAADGGNAQAAAYLIRLVRSGNQMNIRREPTRARDYLETYAPILTDVAVWQLETSITAEVARNASDMAALFDQIESNRRLITKGFGADLYAANPNAAIYVIQRSLADQGYNVGTPDGMIGPRTLRAMNAACRQTAPIAACEDSVLRPDVISAIIDQV